MCGITRPAHSGGGNFRARSGSGPEDFGAPRSIAAPAAKRAGALRCSQGRSAGRVAGFSPGGWARPRRDRHGRPSVAQKRSPWAPPTPGSCLDDRLALANGSPDPVDVQSEPRSADPKRRISCRLNHDIGDVGKPATKERHSSPSQQSAELHYATRRGSKYSAVPSAQSGTRAGTASSTRTKGITLLTSLGCTNATSTPKGSSFERSR